MRQCSYVYNIFCDVSSVKEDFNVFSSRKRQRTEAKCWSLYICSWLSLCITDSGNLIFWTKYYRITDVDYFLMEYWSYLVSGINLLKGNMWTICIDCFILDVWLYKLDLNFSIYVFHLTYFKVALFITA